MFSGLRSGLLGLLYLDRWILLDELAGFLIAGAGLFNSGLDIVADGKRLFCRRIVFGRYDIIILS